MEENIAILKRLPKTFAIGMGAERRGAFPRRGAVGYLLRVKEQVMRAGLDRNRKSLGSGSPQIVECLRRREMHDMYAALVLAAEPDHEPDCFDFSALRSALEIRGVAGRVPFRLFEILGQFRVDQ